MAALLENLRYDPTASSNLSLADDANSSEGKFGIPRFAGDPAALQEYSFRVTVRQSREKMMDKTEVKKMGPLGLRLIEGLRGDAFRLAQQLSTEDLAGEDGPQLLLALFNENLKPRKAQEARELFAAGSRDGGILSRQTGEPMSSYIMRRKAWWTSLQSLDNGLTVSGSILAEQLLANSGITEDQRLMVRTMLQGNMTFERVGEELIAQHPRIHEKERRHGRSFGGKQSSWRKGGGKSSGYRSYWGEADAWDGSDADWENGSQSLSGYTAEYVQESWDDGNHENDSYAAIEYNDASEYDDTFAEDYVGYFVEWGLDFEDEEACALAAETIQLEHEAYNVRHQAKGKGHSAFGNHRNFEVSGSLSFHERRAKLQQLKARTECRRCGQRGHWSGDAACPKGQRKFGSDGGKSGGRSKSSGKSSSSGKKGSSAATSGSKPRVVYFSLHSSGETGATSLGYMALHGDRGQPGSGNGELSHGVQVPPPTGLTSPTTPSNRPGEGQVMTPEGMATASRMTGFLSSPMGLAPAPRAPMTLSSPSAIAQAATSLSSSTAPSLSSSMAIAFAPMSGGPTHAPTSATTPAGVSPGAGLHETPDQALERLVQTQRVQQTLMDMPAMPEFRGVPLDWPLDSDQARVLQALEQLQAMEVDDSGPAGYPNFPGQSPEFGHQSPAEAPDPQFEQQQQHREPSFVQQQPSSLPPATITTTTSTTHHTCTHQRTTRKGTNKYYNMVTCMDCHQVLVKEPKTADGAGGSQVSAPSANATPQAAATCQHLRVTNAGSNGFRWRQKCLDCGHVESGLRGANRGLTGSSPHSIPQLPVPPSSSGRTCSLREVHEILRTSVVIASVKASENQRAEFTMEEVHRMVDAVAMSLPAIPDGPSSSYVGGSNYATPMGSPAPTTASTSTVNSGLPAPTGLPPHPRHGKIVNFGKYKGQPFWMAYQDEGYIGWCYENMTAQSCRGLKELTNYFREMQALKTMSIPTSSTAFMAEAEDEERPSQEKDMVAILDLGCNKTCHGSLWMDRYIKACGLSRDDFALMETDGSFNGIGGKVKVNGIRKFETGFELENGQLAVGDIESTELADSNAPLLLSIGDQRKLGLTVELNDHREDRVFSSTLNSYLKVTNMNGLIGIVLLPSEISKITYLAEETENDKDMEHQDDLMDQAPEEPDEEDVSPVNAVALNHLDLDKETRKTMTRGQRKMLVDTMEEIEAQDVGLWSTLRGRHRPPLPHGCRVFLMEIFAGAAVLTSMATSFGFPVAQPVDLNTDGSNLLDPAVRNKIDMEINDMDPYVLTFAPVCGPWGSWSRFNMARGEDIMNNILAQRDTWYPVLQWMSRLIKRRLARGRKVLCENPWGSELWATLCMDKLIRGEFRDQETQSKLELVRGDLCEFCLRDRINGLPHMKPTGFLTASDPVKVRLQRRCSGLHAHQPLEGSGRTRAAQQWTSELCKAIFLGFLDELEERTLCVAFAAEDEQEEKMEDDSWQLGTLDYIHNEHDLALRDLKPDRLNEQELQRQEGMEELPPPPDTVEKEVQRKQKWMRASRPIRLALRRLHNMTGHSSVSAMQQMLKTAGASSQVLEAARHFSCETCLKRRSVERPNVVKPPNKLEFNHEISVDCFELRDSAGNRHTIFSVICLGTLFHQAYWVAAGGVPRSSSCADALLHGWFAVFGPPKHLVCDRGMHNRGRLQDLLRINGVVIRHVGLEAPFQLGRGERQGGLLKDLMKTTMEEKQIIGVREMQMLVAETVMIKNCRLNQHGFTPIQWVLGRMPTDRTSLTDEGADGPHLGVHEEVQNPEDVFSKQLEIRQAAKMAFARVDSTRRVRAALLRKSVPLRGPYNIGDLICFYRRERWMGPARIVGREGRGSFWVIHGGVPIVVPESNMRPASTTEIMAKQLMELRPSRKRQREASGENDALPFGEDLITPNFQDNERLPSYVELPQEAGPSGEPQPGLGGPPGLATVPEEVPWQPPQQDEAAMEPHPIEEPETPYIGPAGPESEHAPSSSSTSSTPSIPVPPGRMETIPALTLNQAMTRSLDALDGISHRPLPVPPPGLQQPETRERSRSPHRDGANVPVPCGGDAMMAKEMKYWSCFLAKRYTKKVVKKVGAGRQLTYSKCEPRVQALLDETRKKEWQNWKQFKAVKIIPPEQVHQFRQENPEVEVLPTRWHEIDKAEVGEDEKLKSRLIVRGDLEKNNDLRTDSPTVSQLYLNVIISYSACTGLPLGAGDISAAFLQGTGINRKLALRLPDGGVPDDDVSEGSLLLCEKSVYGTRDAPRGFWKGLHETFLENGLVQVPLETSAYYLPGPQGEVCGLLGTHVDDLLWCGGSAMSKTMMNVQKKYKFGAVEGSEFKFCGRMIRLTDEGILVTCPNVLDRTKAIFIEPSRRLQRGAEATQAEIAQLRSVVGSLAWLGRVCRPDLSFSINQLQSVQGKARVQDLIQANKVLNHALKTRDKGIFYPAKPFLFEEAILISVTDASHAASLEQVHIGQIAGHRSQSGRLLLLAPASFETKGEGYVHLLSWSSNTIKRVCRSTLQAETLSLQLGSEECEHLRQCLYYMKNLSSGGIPSKNYVMALDHMICLWLTLQVTYSSSHL